MTRPTPMPAAVTPEEQQRLLERQLAVREQLAAQGKPVAPIGEPVREIARRSSPAPRPAPEIER